MPNFKLINTNLLPALAQAMQRVTAIEDAHFRAWVERMQASGYAYAGGFSSFKPEQMMAALASLDTLALSAAGLPRRPAADAHERYLICPRALHCILTGFLRRLVNDASYTLDDELLQQAIADSLEIELPGAYWLSTGWDELDARRRLEAGGRAHLPVSWCASQEYPFVADRADRPPTEADYHDAMDASTERERLQAEHQQMARTLQLIYDAARRASDDETHWTLHCTVPDLILHSGFEPTERTVANAMAITNAEDAIPF
jgi:hypothetical protein